MISPDELLAAWVMVLQATPSLVALLPGGVDAIASYTDGVDGCNVRQAIYEQQPGSVLVVWNGFGAVRVGGSAAARRRHSFSLFLRASGQGSYGALCYWLSEGVPQEGEPPLPAALKLLHYAIHPGCFPMDLDLPKAQRNVLLVGAGGETLDYFEVQAGLVEIED